MIATLVTVVGNAIVVVIVGIIDSFTISVFITVVITIAPVAAWFALLVVASKLITVTRSGSYGEYTMMNARQGRDQRGLACKQFRISVWGPGTVKE